MVIRERISKKNTFEVQLHYRVESIRSWPRARHCVSLAARSLLLSLEKEVVVPRSFPLLCLCHDQEEDVFVLSYIHRHRELLWNPDGVKQTSDDESRKNKAEQLKLFNLTCFCLLLPHLMIRYKEQTHVIFARVAHTNCSTCNDFLLFFLLHCRPKSIVGTPAYIAPEVICDTYTAQGVPIPTKKRGKAAEISMILKLYHKFPRLELSKSTLCLEKMSSGLWVDMLEGTLLLLRNRGFEESWFSYRDQCRHYTTLSSMG
ncbi:unnamed protein product [Lactuca virosa]|uniref:Non-specific serine/threonine protein kinase n=1 Tax=Lactuca virosa TaxID=75947 RepID=A0AAU9PT22_9ASTR|nr:unnamed protein product [Lactuca virosa]